MNVVGVKPHSTIISTVLLFTAICVGQTQASSTSFSLGDRISCQTAIERVYWQHRTAAQGSDSAKLSFEESVPQAVIQEKAEDAVLKSAALEQLWGVTITDAQLQSELDRMAANTKAPEVLHELFVALDNDPQKAVECLARPQLVDRFIQTYYSRDERFHGDLKSSAQSELSDAGSAAALRNTSGTYREIEWRRGKAAASASDVFGLDPKAFDSRVSELRRSLGRAGGQVSIGSASGLREDQNRFLRDRCTCNGQPATESSYCAMGEAVI